MKFIFGKNNSNINSNYIESSRNLKKSAGSATDLFGNNNNIIKKTKTKTKNSSDLTNINLNQLGYILTTTGNNNKAFFQHLVKEGCPQQTRK